MAKRTTKRPNGSITSRGADTWRIRWGGQDDPLTGQRRQHSRTVKGTRDDAEKALRAELVKLDNGAVEEDRRITVAALASKWLIEVKPAIGRQTHHSYSQLLNTYVIPEIGGRPAASITKDAVTQLRNRLGSVPRRRTGKPLSPQSIIHVMRTLSQVYDYGIEHEILARNPVKAVRKPKVDRREFNLPDSAGLQSILDWMRIHAPAYRLPALFSAVTGLRRGEVLGLRWEDHSYDKAGTARVMIRRSVVQAGHTAVVQETKTAGSNRLIELPDPLDWQLRQWSGKVTELGGQKAGFMFTMPFGDGGPLLPSSLTQAFRRGVIACGFVSESGQPLYHFHSLRHFYATTMLLADQHPFVVSTNLGHSDVKLTLNTYSHVTPGLKRRAAETMGREASALFQSRAPALPAEQT